MTIPISILHSFKKAGGFIYKHRKKILFFIISSIFVFCILFINGIITPPKSFYMWYFENNKGDFEKVAAYFNNTDMPRRICWNDLKELDNIDDDSVRQSILKILYLGDFGSVSGCNSTSVRFSARNLFERAGEPKAIVYDPTQNNEEWSEDYWGKNDEYIKYSYTYEPLGDNWYYKYKSR